MGRRHMHGIERQFLWECIGIQNAGIHSARRAAHIPTLHKPFGKPDLDAWLRDGWHSG